MMTERRIFNYDNIEKTKIVSGSKNMYFNSITACGCLFYKQVKGSKYLLLISYDNSKHDKLDDFGGKVEISDFSVMDTIVRETAEESNGLIDRCILEKYSYNSFYNKRSKYYNIVIQVDNNFFPDVEVFDNFEQFNGTKRKIGWYNYGECKSNLSLRLLLNKKLIKFLDEPIVVTTTETPSRKNNIDIFIYIITFMKNFFVVFKNILRRIAELLRPD